MKRRHLTVEDLMSTAVIAMKSGDKVGQAQLEMHLASIRHLPVIDDKNHVVGMVSNRDLVRALASGRHKTDLPIGEIMTHPVKTISPRTPADEAAEILLRMKIGALPVVADDGQLVGIVTETDFVAVARDALRS